MSVAKLVCEVPYASGFARFVSDYGGLGCARTKYKQNSDVSFQPGEVGLPRARGFSFSFSDDLAAVTVFS